MMKDKLHWHCQKIDQISQHIMLDILRLRSAVFVVEQACIYADIDSWDHQAWWIWGQINQQIIATGRIIAPSDQSPWRLGRLVVDPAWRGQGHGRTLVQFALDKIFHEFAADCIGISAQAHLQNFYQDFGFIPQGSIYLEDGIAHIAMLHPGGNQV